MTVIELVEQLGGIQPVADSLGLDYQCVRAWRLRGRIPARHWPAVAELARRRRVRGVSIEALAMGEIG